MGQVFSAYDERLDRRVALKNISPDKAGEPRARERFLREARIAARLDHPSLVHVHDILDDASGSWIVMELVEGETLATLVKTGPLPVERCVDLGLEIAQGLAAAHAAGILHRDLKTENVLVTTPKDGAPGGGHAKILDFGLSKPLEPGDWGATLTKSGELIGTPRAMSPEQAQGLAVDARSDLFAFGVLLYEILSGDSPFLGPGPVETLNKVCHDAPEPIRDKVTDLPNPLGRLIDTLLAKDPTERPESAQRVVEMLRGLRSADLRGVDAESRVERRESSAAVRRPATDDSEFHLSGERRPITVLCGELISADDSGSLDPEVLYEILPQFRNLVRGVLERFGGHLADFQGHRLVIYVGYPRARDDDAHRAVRAAQALIDGCADLAVGDGIQASARAGIHTGPAVVLGGHGGKETVALGATLDTASLIRDHTAPGSVAVSPATQHLLGEHLETASASLEPIPDGEVTSSTLENPTPFVIVDGSRDRWNPLERVSAAAPLVGRDKELGLLVDRFEICREGVGQAVLLSGEAGMGKSRLLWEVRRRLEGSDCRWLTTAGTMEARGMPLQPIVILARALIGVDDEVSSEQQRQHLENVLRAVEFPFDETGPPLLSLMSGTPNALSDPAHQQDALDLLLELLLETSESTPTVVACEDLHWMDPSSLAFIGRLAEERAAAPLLLLMTTRPESKISWTQSSSLTQLRLGGLTPEQTLRMLEALGGDRGFDSGMRSTLAERSDGIPRFVETLASHAYGEPPDADRTSVPPRLVGGLLGQLDSLGTAKELAQWVSVLGRAFDPSQLLSQAAWDKETLNHELGRLVDADVLERLEDGATRNPLAERYRFRLALMREVALASLVDSDRRRLAALLEGPV